MPTFVKYLYFYLFSEAVILYPCISCGREVRPRQEAFLCKTCDRWQHRTCGTGVTQATYRHSIRTKTSIDWTCTDCSPATSPAVSPPASPLLSPAASPATSPAASPAVSSPASPVSLSSPISPLPQLHSPSPDSPVSPISPLPQLHSPLPDSPVSPVSFILSSTTVVTPPVRQPNRTYVVTPEPVSLPASPATSPLASTSPHVSRLEERSRLSYVEPVQHEESNLQNSIPTPDF